MRMSLRLVRPALCLLGLATALSACTPTWWVQGKAMAESGTTVTAACIEDALRASGVDKPEWFPLTAGGVGYSVSSEGENATTLYWDKAHPREITITMKGSGVADKDAVARERAAREALVRKLTEACGTFEEKVEEKCDNAECGS